MAANGEPDQLSAGELSASKVIANELRQAIRSGTYREGDKLPSQRVLASQHSVAQNTAREAYRILALEGLVEAVTGSGVFVRAPFSQRVATPGQPIMQTSLTQAESEAVSGMFRDSVYALVGAIHFALKGAMGEAEWIESWKVSANECVIEWGSGPSVDDVLSVVLPSVDDEGRLAGGVAGLRARLTRVTTDEVQLYWLPVPGSRIILRRSS